MVADSILTGQVSGNRVAFDITPTAPLLASVIREVFFQAALGPTLGPSWITSVETVRIPNPS